MPIAINGTVRPVEYDETLGGPTYSAPSTRENDDNIWGSFSRNLTVTLANTTISLSPFSGIIGGDEIVSTTQIDVGITVPSVAQDIYVFVKTDAIARTTTIDVAQVNTGGTMLWESDYQTNKETPICHLVNVPAGTTDLSPYEVIFDIKIGGIGGSDNPTPTLDEVLEAGSTGIINKYGAEGVYRFDSDNWNFSCSGIDAVETEVSFVSSAGILYYTDAPSYLIDDAEIAVWADVRSLKYDLETKYLKQAIEDYSMLENTEELIVRKKEQLKKVEREYINEKIQMFEKALNKEGIDKDRIKKNIEKLKKGGI